MNQDRMQVNTTVYEFIRKKDMQGKANAHNDGVGKYMIVSRWLLLV
jgi:hypothetical protein